MLRQLFSFLAPIFNTPDLSPGYFVFAVFALAALESIAHFRSRAFPGTAMEMVESDVGEHPRRT
jgi:hypothetical protein